MSLHGSSLHFAATQQLGRVRSEAGIERFSVWIDARNMQIEYRFAALRFVSALDQTDIR